jgi:hypothetical protein
MLRYAALNRELCSVIARCRDAGERVIVDYAREDVTLWDVSKVRRVTEIMVDALPPEYMCALKMTSFGSRQSEDIAEKHVDGIITQAKARGVRVCIDAEDVLYRDACYDLMRRHNTRENAVVYATYQMYRRDAFDELLSDMESSQRHGFKLGVKLVRGAYLRTQSGVFDVKADTDHSYNKGMTYALSAPHVHTILATHNTPSLRIARKFPKERYVTAHLMGFGGNPTYRYVPFGNLVELTPYLWRRFKERLSWG